MPFLNVFVVGIRKLVFVACVLSLTACASSPNARDVDSWFHGAPSSFYAPNAGIPLSTDRFYEISASNLATAEYWLENDSFFKLDQLNARGFGQSNFSCPDSTVPYLIRAVYENGGTGAFTLARVGTALWVRHHSLGRASKMYRTALVVCLDFTPTELFHSIGLAR